MARKASSLSESKNSSATIGFEAKMARLVGELNGQFSESAKLEKVIRDNLKGIGYGQ